MNGQHLLFLWRYSNALTADTWTVWGDAQGITKMWQSICSTLCKQGGICDYAMWLWSIGQCRC